MALHLTGQKSGTHILARKALVMLHQQNPDPREIPRSSGDVFPKTFLLLAVYGYSKHGPEKNIQKCLLYY